MLVGSGIGDITASVYGSILLILLGLAVGRPVFALSRLLPGAFVILGFCAFPEVYRGYPLLWPRFALLLIPAMLLAFRPCRDVGRNGPLIRHATLLAAVGVWACIFSLRLMKLNRETSHFHDIADALPRGLRVRPVIFDPESDAFPDLPVFTHLPAYYLVDKGGTQGYSFAIYPSSAIRYREGIIPRMSSGEEWAPEAFRVEKELHNYDCFMVHSKRDRYKLLGASRGAVELCTQSGDWRSYCVTKCQTGARQSVPVSAN